MTPHPRRDTDAHWETARAVCTPKEYETLELRVKHGLSLRTISLTLNVSRSSVRSRLENANRKIALALEQGKDAA